MTEVLYVDGLTVGVEDKVIVRDVSLRVREGEVHVLMGPNGSGKSTLLRAIMGDPRYKVVKGLIKFLGMDITELRAFERARLGIAMAFQSPPRLNVKTAYVLEKLAKKYGSTIPTDYIKLLNVEHLLNRSLFHGFSGGESKKMELLIVRMQNPKLALLDEPDSGVDVDSLARIADFINEIVDRGSTVVLVTHLGHALRFLRRIDEVHVMYNGTIVASGGIDVIRKVLELGYSKFIEGHVR